MIKIQGCEHGTQVIIIVEYRCGQEKKALGAIGEAGKVRRGEIIKSFCVPC